jgi:hypothetical protein
VSPVTAPLVWALKDDADVGAVGNFAPVGRPDEAFVLQEAGERESVKVVQARLGHASASQTLDTYSHLWPDSDDRTRTAVDSVLSADYVRTEGVVDGRTP